MPKLDAAREPRGIHFILEDDPDYDEIVNNVRRKFEIWRASVMLCKDWKTFRCSRMTVLSDPAAKLIKMKVQVFSNPDSSNKWATEVEDVWNEHGFVEQFNFAPREVQFIWHVLPDASTLDVKKRIQRSLNGQNPESLGERIMLRSVLHDIEWTKKKAMQKPVCTFPKKLQHLRPNSRTLVLPGAHVRKYVVDWKFQRTSGEMRHYCIADG